MMRSIVITDLTRFGPGKPTVCTAGIDPQTGECIRPLPYLKFAKFTRLGIFPGGLLRGDFTPESNPKRPHTEDSQYNRLKFCGACCSGEFLSVLKKSTSEGLEEGFQVKIKAGEKVINERNTPSCSIITLKINPQDLQIVEDDFRPGKIRLHFTDRKGRPYRFFPIADLGFHDYAQRHRESGALDELNTAISEQEEVYLRIGLGRLYTNPQGKEGYWLQANGIYTFPEKLTYIRSYCPEKGSWQ